jgi:hypothetical protein
MPLAYSELDRKNAADGTPLKTPNSFTPNTIKRAKPQNGTRSIDQSN